MTTCHHPLRDKLPFLILFLLPLLLLLTGCGDTEADTISTAYDNCKAWISSAHPEVDPIEGCTLMFTNDPAAFEEAFGS